MFKHGKHAGDAWEKVLDQYHAMYAKIGVAVVFHAPPEFRVLRNMESGRFLGCFTGEGPPDYVGVSGPFSFIMEAKTCADGRLPFANIQPHQAKRMTAWEDHDDRNVALILLWERKHKLRVVLLWSDLRDRWETWYTSRIRKARVPAGEGSLSKQQLKNLGISFEPEGWLYPLIRHLKPPDPF